MVSYKYSNFLSEYFQSEIVLIKINFFAEAVSIWNTIFVLSEIVSIEHNIFSEVVSIKHNIFLEIVSIANGCHQDLVSHEQFNSSTNVLQTGK